MSVPIAAIDVGSNSVRLAVMSVDEHAGLELLEEARDVPRLIRDVEEHGAFQPKTIKRLLDILSDFRLIAEATGARIVAVATSAARDATTGPEVVARVREELGIDLRVIDGDEEARLAFLGATYSLPARSGVVIDIGGGSMELVRFQDRVPVQTLTLPLGAVRLTDRFLRSDPLVTSELRKLRAYVAAEVDAAHLAPLDEGGELVGTGGTIRNLGKIDRADHSYPISRLHGYEVTRERMRRVADRVQLRSVSERRSIAGLNEDRADTIVAGALVVDTIMTTLRAPSLTVSGQGLREGMVLDASGLATPSVAALRAGSLRSTVGRFAHGHLEMAERRRATVQELVTAAGYDATPEMADALAAAAYVEDVGRGVEYYSRARHAEVLLRERGLDGWTHREVALICAIHRQARQETYVPANYRPLIAARDHEAIAASGCLLALADAIAIRRPANGSLRWQRDGKRLTIGDEALARSAPEDLVARFKRTFGMDLVFESAPRS